MTRLKLIVCLALFCSVNAKDLPPNDPDQPCRQDPVVLCRLVGLPEYDAAERLVRLAHPFLLEKAPSGLKASSVASEAERFLATSPRSPFRHWALTYLAVATEANGNVASAQKTMVETLRLYPENPILQYRLARLYSNKNQLRLAMLHASAAIYYQSIAAEPGVLKLLDSAPPGGEYAPREELTTDILVIESARMVSRCAYMLLNSNPKEETGRVLLHTAWILARWEEFNPIFRRLYLRQSAKKFDPAEELLFVNYLDFLGPKAGSEVRSEWEELFGKKRAMALTAAARNALQRLPNQVLALINGQFQFDKAWKPGFAGTKACGNCHTPSHQDHVRDWSNSSMGQVLRKVPSPEDAFWLPILKSTFPEAAERNTVIARFEVNAATVRLAIWNQGKVHEYPVNFLIGLHEVVAFATIEQESGRVYRLPVLWNHRAQRLETYGSPLPIEVAKGRVQAFSLGTNPNGRLHQTILAPEVGSQCAPCHTTRLTELPFAMKGSYLELGVGCEACHGHGADHADARAKRTRDPGVLSFQTKRVTAGLPRQTIKPQFDTTCLNCHTHSMLWPTPMTAGKPVNFRDEPFPFTPRLQRHSLEKFGRRTFGAAGELRNATFIGEEFTRTKCFLSGGVSCGSCHQVHSKESKPASGLLRAQAVENKTCTTCHAKGKYESRDHTRHLASHANAVYGNPTECVTCHMPKTLNGLGGALDRKVPAKTRSHRMDQLPAYWLVASLPANQTIAEEYQESFSCYPCHAKQTAKWFSDSLAGWTKPLVDRKAAPSSRAPRSNSGKN
jgi:hypothetical protein